MSNSIGLQCDLGPLVNEIYFSHREFSDPTYDFILDQLNAEPAHSKK